MFIKRTKNNSRLDNIVENLIEMKDISDKLFTFKEKFDSNIDRVINEYRVNSKEDKPIHALALRL